MKTDSSVLRSLALGGRRLLDIAYPPQCGLCGALGDPLCRACRNEFLPLAPQVPAHSPLDYRYAPYLYDGRAAQAVTRLKFARQTALARPMSEILSETAVSLGLPYDLAIPVPIHWRRRFVRGFNQAELLVEALPEDRCDPRGMRRIRYTPPQVGLAKAARERNLQGAFRVETRVHGLRVLLIDDVATTGNTAEECAATLKRAGARWVGILTFAGKP